MGLYLPSPILPDKYRWSCTNSLQWGEHSWGCAYLSSSGASTIGHVPTPPVGRAPLQVHLSPPRSPDEYR